MILSAETNLLPARRIVLRMAIFASGQINHDVAVLLARALLFDKR